MQSILIVSKNKTSALEKAIYICKENKIADIDTNVENFDKSVGIEDIRNMQKKLFLKPIKSNIKSIIINSFPGITIESQNALLKVLEEPPLNTIMLIITENKNLFLSTILSRCKIIEVKEKIQFSDEEVLNYQKDFKEILEAGLGKRLKLAQDFGQSKEEAITWLEQMLITIRKTMIDKIISSKGNESDGTFYLNILKNFQKTHTIIKTSNVNQRFALENLFLQI
ncbi:MAG: hypothetical protein HYT08_04255 [Candidatus Levybacteria bacterium]|nr:hypothetical protein [Candidatus Levybacteria bacterium]